MTDFIAWAKGQMDKMEAEAEGEMFEAAAEGYGAWVEGIETLGTGYGVWHKGWWKENPFRNESPYMSTGEDGSHPGRVHTGNMRDSVEFRPGDKKVEIGFLSHHEEYFRHQELGFTTPEGVGVEPMKAQAQVHSVIDDTLIGKGWKKE